MGKKLKRVTDTAMFAAVTTGQVAKKGKDKVASSSALSITVLLILLLGGALLFLAGHVWGILLSIGVIFYGAARLFKEEKL